MAYAKSVHHERGLAIAKLRKEREEWAERVDPHAIITWIAWKIAGRSFH